MRLAQTTTRRSRSIRVEQQGVVSCQHFSSDLLCFLFFGLAWHDQRRGIVENAGEEPIQP